MVEINKALPENRKHLRLNSNLPMSYAWYSDNSMSPQDYSGITKNLSQKEICFITETPPPKMAFLEIEISHPEEGIGFDALAVVMWVRKIEDKKYEVSAKIFAMNDVGRRQIDRGFARSKEK